MHPQLPSASSTTPSAGAAASLINPPPAGGTGLLAVDPQLHRVGRIGGVAGSGVAREAGRHRACCDQRRRDQRLRGALASGLGARSGGHLTEARELASRRHAYDDTPSQAGTDTASGPAREG